MPVTVQTSAGATLIRVNMKQAPPLKYGFISLGLFELQQGEAVSVVIATEGAGGLAHADAVQVVRAE